MKQRLTIRFLILASIFALTAPSLTARADTGDGDPAPRQVIMTLRDGAAPEAVAARHGGSVIGRLPGIDSYLLALPAAVPVQQALARVRADGEIKSADLNHGVATFTQAQQFFVDYAGDGIALGQDADLHYENQWAVAKIGLPAAQERARGSGVIVAVLDTGIARWEAAFAGKLVGGYDFVDADDDPAESGNGPAAGHGTLLAGIVTLVAPESKIMPVRVLDSNGQGTLFAAAQGIVYAVDRGARVVNLSLGSTHDTGVLRYALDYATERGSIVVASVGNRLAGNQGAEVLYPARYEEAVAVAASDPDDAKASFSNWGTWTDFTAPGVSVVSIHLSGNRARISGTSPATAFVAGAAALLWSEHPAWDRQDVIRRLEQRAVDITAQNPENLRGKLGRRLDLAAATAP